MVRLYLLLALLTATIAYSRGDSVPCVCNYNTKKAVVHVAAYYSSQDVGSIPAADQSGQAYCLPIIRHETKRWVNVRLPNGVTGFVHTGSSVPETRCQTNTNTQSTRAKTTITVKITSQQNATSTLSTTKLPTTSSTSTTPHPWHPCLCNKNHLELMIMECPNPTVKAIGLLHIADAANDFSSSHCVAKATRIKTVHGWEAVVYNNKIGYVEVDEGVSDTLCPGPVIPITNQTSSSKCPLPHPATQPTTSSTSFHLKQTTGDPSTQQIHGGTANNPSTNTPASPSTTMPSSVKTTVKSSPSTTMPSSVKTTVKSSPSTTTMSSTLTTTKTASPTFTTTRKSTSRATTLPSSFPSTPPTQAPLLSYPCICIESNEQIPVMSCPTFRSPPVGFMYKSISDANHTHCAPLVTTVQAPNGWTAVSLYGQIGFILKNNKDNRTTCTRNGSPPPSLLSPACGLHTVPTALQTQAARTNTKTSTIFTSKHTLSSTTLKQITPIVTVLSTQKPLTNTQRTQSVMTSSTTTATQTMMKSTNPVARSTTTMQTKSKSTTLASLSVSSTKSVTSTSPFLTTSKHTYTCDRLQVAITLAENVPLEHPDSQSCDNGGKHSSEAAIMKLCGAPKPSMWHAGAKVIDICSENKQYSPIGVYAIGRYFVNAGIFAGCIDNGRVVQMFMQNCQHNLQLKNMTKADANHLLYFTEW